MKELKILIADDHPLVLKGMKAEFSLRGFQHIYEAKNGVEALQQIEEHQLDVAILDVDMPVMSGMEVAKRLKESETKTIIVTHHKEDGFIIQAKVLGVHAYLLKEDTFKEVEQALESLEYENFYLSSSFKKNKLEQLDDKIQLLKNLSLAERQVLKHISEGFETAEVAEILSVSKRTIHKHRSNIISKLNLESHRDALANYAQNNRLLIREFFK